MSTLDIRKPITHIKYNENMAITKTVTAKVYCFEDLRNNQIIGTIGSESDLDNLIAALQKAKELWGEK